MKLSQELLDAIDGDSNRDAQISEWARMATALKEDLDTLGTSNRIKGENLQTARNENQRLTALLENNIDTFKTISARLDEVISAMLRQTV